MKLLLTGAGGSIGVHVFAHIMHNTDWDVVLLDSFRHKGYAERIEEVLKDHQDWKKRTEVIQHDLVIPFSDADAKKLKGTDIMLHLSAMSDVQFSIENPVWVIQNNINSTLVMLELARKIEPKQFIYFSTDEVYGPVKKGQAHKEGAPHKPSNPYSASKAGSEDICYAYWRSYGVPLIITNTMNNFGEMQSKDKFPVIVQKKVEAGEVVTIHGNKKEIGTRFYIHSRNVADALLHIIKIGATKHVMGEIDEPKRYHIVGNACLTNTQMARIIASIMGKKLEYEIVDFHKDNAGHDIHYGLEDNNLRSSGWKEPVDFETSLRNTIEWQQEHKEWIE